MPGVRAFGGEPLFFFAAGGPTKAGTVDFSSGKGFVSLVCESMCVCVCVHVRVCWAFLSGLT
jgi:hypothetical protein